MGKVFVRILPSPSCAVSLMVQSNSDLIFDRAPSRDGGVPLPPPAIHFCPRAPSRVQSRGPPCGRGNSTPNPISELAALPALGKPPEGFRPSMMRGRQGA